MFPLFVRLDTLVEVISPRNRLVKNLLDSKSLHFLLVFKDVVEDALSNGVEVVFVDLVKHGVDQVLDSLFLDGVKVTWDELNNVSQPVLSDGCNDIDWDLILDVLFIS